MTSTPSSPCTPSRQRRRAASTGVVAVAAFGLVAALTGTAQAAPTIDLSTAEDFAVLAGAGITNTGPTTVSGDMGSDPTSPAYVGVTHPLGVDRTAGDPVTSGAKTARTDAMTVAENASPTGTLAGGTLGGKDLGPGVYHSAGFTLDLTGTLTLDGGGSYDSVFVFQATSDLVTAGSSQVVLQNGAQACNVFWQVKSSATLGGSSSFAGTVLAQTSITVGNLATVDGRVLASTGTVTLDQDTIVRPDLCRTGPVVPVVVPTPPTSAPPSSTTPAPPTAATPPTGSTSATASTPATGSGASGTTGRPTYGQVGRVPVGAVDTGDGSTS